jgi:hypothetical protein
MSVIELAAGPALLKVKAICVSPTGLTATDNCPWPAKTLAAELLVSGRNE